MRLAAISDIHGNLHALDAVLADIAASGADLTVNLGDILSGPLWITETAERLMALGLPTIRGNHERQALAPDIAAMGASDAFAAERLQPRHRAWLAGLPATLAPTPEVFCCHGTPDNDLVYFLESVDAAGMRPATLAEATGRAGGVLQGVPHGLILCGHTHVPRAMRLDDGRLVVNPGSVGLQAYDDDHPHPHAVQNGTPHARYALLTRRAAGWQVELRAVPYDAEPAARMAQQHARPDWAHALRTGFVVETAQAAAPHRPVTSRA